MCGIKDSIRKPKAELERSLKNATCHISKQDVQAIKTPVTAASPPLCSPGDWGGRSQDTGPRKLGYESKK